jgi:putative addiction module component (TIGR02574 family)
MAVEKLIAEALTLSAEDRGKLVTALLESLDSDGDGDGVTREDWEAAWAIEIDRRIKDADEGRTTMIPHEVVMQELRSRFPKR